MDSAFSLVAVFKLPLEMLANDARSEIWKKIKISNFEKVIVESQKSYVYESHWIFYFIFCSPSGENWRPKEIRA